MHSHLPQLGPRDRLKKRLAAQLTPQERMARMEALQEACFERLRRSPEGLDRFWRRNLRKRAISRHDLQLPR